MTTPVVDAATVSVCSAWASAEDAFNCCADLAQTDTDVMDWSLLNASDLLYELSGHRYPGPCEALVRPLGTSSCWVGRHDWYARDCCCHRVSKVRLAGYPVQEILEVMIDDLVLDPSEYELQYRRELVRLVDADGRAQRWPACQRRDLPSVPGTIGTFFVRYRYGQNPPPAGVGAAAQLACEIAKQCPGTNDDAGECRLPEGTVRVTRQGLTIDSEALGMWLLGSLRTGLPLVDAFLSVYGRTGPARQRAALSTPEMDPWPMRVE